MTYSCLGFTSLIHVMGQIFAVWACQRPFLLLISAALLKNVQVLNWSKKTLPRYSASTGEQSSSKRLPRLWSVLGTSAELIRQSCVYEMLIIDYSHESLIKIKPSLQMRVHEKAERQPRERLRTIVWWVEGFAFLCRSSRVLRRNARCCFVCNHVVACDMPDIIRPYRPQRNVLLYT